MGYPSRTEELLEAILAELKQLNKNLGDGDDEIIASPAIPNIPRYPSAPLPMPTALNDRCPRCGITLSGVMGYVCSDPSCPTGLGPMTCKAGA